MAVGCLVPKPALAGHSSPVMTELRLANRSNVNLNAAVMRAEALSRKEDHVGAVAFSCTGDPATGDFSDAKVIALLARIPLSPRPWLHRLRSGRNHLVRRLLSYYGGV